LLAAVAPRVKEAVLGSDEERALQRAFQDAFSVMLLEAAETQDQNLTSELEPQMLAFVSDPEVADALLDIALKRQRPPLARLRERFHRLGFDTQTVPLDFDVAINSFSLQLTKELRTGAARSRSPIFNQVALPELDSLQEQLQVLTRSLELTNTAQPRPGSAPPLPSLIVGREDAITDPKTRLGISSGSQEPAPVQVLTAVRGWPGVGKTTLAAALAHDPDIEMVFPDGVLWASLSQPEHLLNDLAAWGRALGIEELVYARSLGEASTRLAAQMRDKSPTP
jgi:hypothetical protein